MNRADMAVHNQGNGLLTRVQLVELLKVSREAWNYQIANKLTTDGFDDWRRGSLFDAIHVSSFREVTQREYTAALAHFKRMAGKPMEAMFAENAGGANDERRRAAFALNRELQNTADVFGGFIGAHRYASAIARRKYKAELDRLTARQLWGVLFTIRNRAAARRGKAVAP